MLSQLNLGVSWQPDSIGAMRLPHWMVRLALSCWCVVACAPPEVSASAVPMVTGLTRVEVEIGHDSTYGTSVADSAGLASITRFVNDRRMAWSPGEQTFWLGGLHAHLRSDTTLVATVSLQDRTLWLFRGDAPSLSQAITPEEAEEFARLLGRETEGPKPPAS